MSDLGQWITGTAACTGADTRSEFEIIGDYLDADEQAQAAGLVLGYQWDGDTGAYTLTASAPADSRVDEFDTIAETVAYIDGYIAGKVAGNG